MGLANLDIKGSQDVEQIKQGIGAVTAGAAIAFMTSVWGVSTSVVFNIIEKILERIVRNKIATLQRRLDYLYPRIIAEQSLVRIADFGERSNESLQGLAEKIGDRLQEAMRVSTSNIGKELQRTLNEIMKPAINSLVNGAQESSERALRSLLSQFSEGLGKTGSEQRQSMENASERINQMVHGLTDKLSEFLESAETQKSEMAKTFEQLMGHFGGRLDDLNEAASTRDRKRHEKFQIEFGSLTTANREAISTLLNGVSSQISEMGALERNRAEGIGKTMGDLVDTQQHLVNSVGGLIENQGLVHTEFMRQLREIQESYVNSARAQEVSSRAVTDASTQMQQAAQQLAQLSGTLRDSAQALGKSIGKAAEDTREAAGLSKNISLALARLEQRHMEITNRMQAVTEKLLEASQHAQSGFEAVDRNLEKFRTGLSGQVQKMESQVADLMRGFALQVKETSEERMAEWNQQTSEYTNQMTQAIHALSGVVDEIEAKTRRD